mgnify:CR=1 FL=1
MKLKDFKYLANWHEITNQIKKITKLGNFQTSLSYFIDFVALNIPVIKPVNKT